MPNWLAIGCTWVSIWAAASHRKQPEATHCLPERVLVQVLFAGQFACVVQAGRLVGQRAAALVSGLPAVVTGSGFRKPFMWPIQTGATASERGVKLERKMR